MEQNLFDSPEFTPTVQSATFYRPKFQLKEFLVGSDPLERSNLSTAILGNLFRIVQIMSVIRTQANMPITITSGYRSFSHNMRVGGVKTSQHLTGSACDFKTYAPYRIHQLVPWIRENIEFGQLIEYDNFLHISLPNAGKVCQYIDKRSISTVRQQATKFLTTSNTTKKEV